MCRGLSTIRDSAVANDGRRQKWDSVTSEGDRFTQRRIGKGANRPLPNPQARNLLTRLTFLKYHAGFLFLAFGRGRAHARAAFLSGSNRRPAGDSTRIAGRFARPVVRCF